VATGAVLVWAATGLVRGSGGRDVNALAVGLLLLAVALAVVRPWRELPVPVLVVAAVLSVAALLVLPIGHVGRAGAVAAGAYVLAAGLVVLVGSWASTSRRADVLAAAVCVAGLLEVCWAFPAWWAGGLSAPGPMVGTFYWWNPYAAYLLAPALLGLNLAVSGPRWVAVGWLTTPLAVAGIAFSSSRATVACLLVGWVIVSAALVLGSPRRLATLGRVALVSALSTAVTFLLTSPLVFRGGTAAFGASVSRSSGGQTVSADGAYRLEFWRQAMAAFRDHPATGSGYGRILTSTKPATSSAYSPLAHNGFLQALGEGGLLLAVPMAVALLGATYVLARSLLQARSGVSFAAAVAGLGLLAHGLVDTDWTYAADVVPLAVCVALAGAARWHDARRERTPRGARFAAAVLISAALVSGLLATGQHFEILHIDRFGPVGPATATSGAMS
jgi:O-antigen ligase